MAIKVTYHFNLKQTKEAYQPTQIMLVVNSNRQRFRIYTKQRVEPCYWDKQRQRCLIPNDLPLRQRTELHQLNLQLNQIRHFAQRADNELATQGEYLTADALRQAVNEALQTPANAIRPLEYFKQLVENYDVSINRRGIKGNDNSKRSYLTALKRLEDYSRQSGNTLTSFDDFNKYFFSSFTEYLYTYTYERGGAHQYTRITVVNTIKVIKNLLRRAYDNEVTDNNYFLKVQSFLPGNSSEKIYLTETEIARIARVKTLSQKELSVRDMFIISCYTALRISDLQALNKATIHKDTITLIQTKTKERVSIPILKEIAELITQYSKKGFPQLRDASANRIIKRLAQRCGINETVSFKENRGGVNQIKQSPKHELISFHTARRSCITNLYKRGYPVNYIMTLSGHRSMQAFQRYVKATSHELTTEFITLLKKKRAI